MEQSVGAAPAEVSKLVKTKFVSMVERHYLKPAVTEMSVGIHGDEVMGGVVKVLVVFGKFELPSTLNCNNNYFIPRVCIIGSAYLAIRYTGQKRRRDEEGPSNQPASKRAKKYALSLYILCTVSCGTCMCHFTSL